MRQHPSCDPTRRRLTRWRPPYSRVEPVLEVELSGLRVRADLRGELGRAAADCTGPSGLTTGWQADAASRPGLAFSVNHMFPSGPAVIPRGSLFAVRPAENSVIDTRCRDATDPPGVGAFGEPEVSVCTRGNPARLRVGGQAGRELRDHTRCRDATDPPGLLDSVNQRLPSGPAVISFGPLFGVRPVANSVITPDVVMRPIRPGLLDSVNQRLPSGRR